MQLPLEVRVHAHELVICSAERWLHEVHHTGVEAIYAIGTQHTFDFPAWRELLTAEEGDDSALAASGVTDTAGASSLGRGDGTLAEDARKCVDSVEGRLLVAASSSGTAAAGTLAVLSLAMAARLGATSP